MGSVGLPVLAWGEGDSDGDSQVYLEYVCGKEQKNTCEREQWVCLDPYLGYTGQYLRVVSFVTS